jgi:hypothetical protein
MLIRLVVVGLPAITKAAACLLQMVGYKLICGETVESVMIRFRRFLGCLNNAWVSRFKY